MHEDKGWKWDRVESDYWHTPSEDLYYYRDRWSGLGLKRFLDLGCGVGRHSIFFACQGFDVTAYDISESGLKILEDKAKTLKYDIRLVCGDNEKLMFEDGSFDCLLSYHAMYHTNTEGLHKVIDEIYRVLSDDGEFFLTLISKSHPDFASNEYELVDANCKLKQEEDGSVLSHFYVDDSELESLFAKFKLLRIRHIEEVFDGKSSWHYFIHGKVLRSKS